jgi:peptidoglycan hydrolase-like protein with peptidoglycan-binding domain
MEAKHVQPADTLHSSNTEAPDPLLRQGDQGEAVRHVQRQLEKAGYHDLDGELLADGHFGDCTRRAVEAFQYDYGLIVDGIVGAKTAIALAHAAYAHRFAATAASGAGSS